MRRLVFVALLATLVAACAGTRPYTPEDLRQVREVYRVLVPTYRTFKAAYLRNDLRTMTSAFRSEQRTCKTVDAIDERDTISASVNLFVVSEGLDNLCNSIEYAYATWRRDHHLSWDRSLNLGPPADLFVHSDVSLKQMPGQLRHPAAPA
jgi:hypothetical protein